MLIERIRIQLRVQAALKEAKKLKNSPIQSAQKALNQLQNALKSLQTFNAKHPLLRRILRWIDQKFCFTPLVNAIRRIQKIAVEIIPPAIKPEPPIQIPPVIKQPSEIVATPKVTTPLPILVPPRIVLDVPQELTHQPLAEILGIDLSQIEGFAKWIEHFEVKFSKEEQQSFIRAFKWYCANEGKKSDKTEIFKRVMFKEEAFLRCVKFLKKTNNSQSALNLKALDEALIRTLPDLFACQLHRDADLTDLVLECMKRNFSQRAFHDLQVKLVDQLGDLIQQLVEQKDSALTNKIRTLYQDHCIKSHLDYVPKAFDAEEIDKVFQQIFAQFKEEHKEYISKDPALEKFLAKPLEGLSRVGIQFFLDLNHFIQGTQKEFVDQIGLAPLIYYDKPLKKLWHIVEELQREDLSVETTDQLIFENLGMIHSYGLFKVPDIAVKIFHYFERNFWHEQIEVLWLHRQAVITITRALEEIDHPLCEAFKCLLLPSDSLKALVIYFGGQIKYFDNYLDAIPSEDHESFIEALEYLYEIKEIEIPINDLLTQIKGNEVEFLRNINHMRQVLPPEEVLSPRNAHELIRQYAIETACEFGAWATSGTIEEVRATFNGIAKSFIQTHFEIAFLPPSDEELPGSIEFLLQLNRFLLLKNEPMLQEELDEILFNALLPILSHHIYTMEGIEELLLDYFTRQLSIIASAESLLFHSTYLEELAADISNQPLKDTLIKLSNRYKNKYVLITNLMRYKNEHDFHLLDDFIREFSYLNSESQIRKLRAINKISYCLFRTLVADGVRLHKIRMKTYASIEENTLVSP